jgi:hypothetical protein
MIFPLTTSTDNIREALSTVRNTVLSLTDKLAMLEKQEFIPGSSGTQLSVREKSLRSRMLMKYFAIDQEFYLVRSYSFKPGGLMYHKAGTPGAI